MEAMIFAVIALKAVRMRHLQRISLSDSRLSYEYSIPHFVKVCLFSCFHYGLIFVQIFYVQTIEECDSLLRAHRVSEVDALGLDIEWKSHANEGRKSRTALLQLSTHTDIFLIHLFHMGEALPNSIVEIFQRKTFA